jgi:CubicO group peptidase (beta-lactamase class C family)
MTTWSRRLPHVSIVVLVALVALANQFAGDAQGPGDAREPLPAAPPAAVGFSEERLTRLDARMKRFVDEGQHAGIVMLVARKGRVVDWRAWGQRDVARQLPMEKDTIFRIYSMSKIITGVAVMALHEEGRIKLDDPVAMYLPALQRVKVFKGGTAAAPVVVPARTPITIKHLLTHTSGFIYGFGNGPLDKIYDSSDAFEATSMDEFVARAVKLPLAHEPGQRFSYGINSDILGAVVEKVSGKKFEDFVDERICRPLGMRDTGFDVPREKMNRLAIVYQHSKPAAGTTNGGQPGPASAGRFVESKPAASSYAEKGRGIAAGGSGMFSTIGDYARLAQMLLNYGELDGARILGRKTVELMTANHLNHLPRVTNEFSNSDGYGLGVGVRVDLAKGNELGSVGQFGWSGAATTTVNIDPREQLVALVFAQHMPYNEHDLFWNFKTLVYQALVE